MSGQARIRPGLFAGHFHIAGNGAMAPRRQCKANQGGMEATQGGGEGAACQRSW
jgi:hypothetical protein